MCGYPRALASMLRDTEMLPLLLSFPAACAGLPACVHARGLCERSRVPECVGARVPLCALVLQQCTGVNEIHVCMHVYAYTCLYLYTHAYTHTCNIVFPMKWMHACVCHSIMCGIQCLYLRDAQRQTLMARCVAPFWNLAP
jgi:hypothetical protein